MPEYGASVQEPASRSTRKRIPQMGFEIADDEFRIPPTIVETSSVPKAFERISNRLAWQEAKLGNNCVFFELGDQTSPKDEMPSGTFFSGSNWQIGGKVSLESPIKESNIKPTKFDAVVIYVNNFLENRGQLFSLLQKTKSRMGYNKPVYIFAARKEGLDVEELKLDLSQMVHDTHFIMPHVLVGRKGKNEDILIETRTKAKRHNTLPNPSEDTETNETEREAAKLRPKTPSEILRASFIKAKFNPDTPIPNGEKCFKCKGPLSFMSHAKPDEENGGYVNVMYRWCLTDGQRGKEIPLKKS